MRVICLVLVHISGEVDVFPTKDDVARPGRIQKQHLLPTQGVTLSNTDLQNVAVFPSGNLICNTLGSAKFGFYCNMNTWKYKVSEHNYEHQKNIVYPVFFGSIYDSTWIPKKMTKKKAEKSLPKKLTMIFGTHTEHTQKWFDVEYPGLFFILKLKLLYSWKQEF